MLATGHIKGHMYYILTRLDYDDIITEIVYVVNKFFIIGKNPPKYAEAAFCHGGGPRKDCEVEFRPTWMPSLKSHYIPLKLKVALMVGR